MPVSPKLLVPKLPVSPKLLVPKLQVSPKLLSQIFGVPEEKVINYEWVIRALLALVYKTIRIN